MTDRAAALAVLAHRHGGTKQARDALAAFEKRYRSDPLVMDKWLMIQATAPGAATLDKVKALTLYSGFTMANPNRVRALIGTFATANQTAFNRADGAGHDFVARRHPGDRPAQSAARRADCDRVPVVAVAGAGAARAGPRGALLIAGGENLSADLRDIVERTLA